MGGIASFYRGGQIKLFHGKVSLPECSIFLIIRYGTGRHRIKITYPGNQAIDLSLYIARDVAKKSMSPDMDVEDIVIMHF